MTDRATRIFLSVFDTPSGPRAGFDEPLNLNPKPSAEYDTARILFSKAGIENVLVAAAAGGLPMNAATRAEYEKALTSLRSSCPARAADRPPGAR